MRLQHELYAEPVELADHREQANLRSTQTVIYER